MKGLFGFWPFISGTFWVTVTATLLAVPPCILTALYLSEYARSSTRAFMKPLMDLLAAIPSGLWRMGHDCHRPAGGGLDCSIYEFKIWLAGRCLR